MTDYANLRHEKALLYLDSIRKGYRRFPPSLQIGLTDHCFNRCVMCDHWKREDKRILPFHELTRILRYGCEHGLETVCYSGGDPMLYPHLNQMMEWHIGAGIEYGFITAGFVPEKIDLDLLSQARFIRISLDSLSNYDKCRRGSISADKVIKSIQRMYRGNLGLGITLTRVNYNEIGDLCSLVIQLGIKEVRIWPVRHNKDYSLNRAQLEIALIDLKLWRAFLITEGISNNLDLCIKSLEEGEEEIPPFSHCKATLYQMFVTPDGNFYPCCIMAADTEIKPNMKSFGMLDGGALDMAQLFSMVPSEGLPDKCHTDCIPRLSFLNHCACKDWNKREFI